MSAGDAGGTTGAVRSTAWRSSRVLRGTVLALGYAALAAVALGCARSPAPSGPGATVLRVMLPPSERDAWTPIARGFERAHPGVRVDLVEGAQSTDLREDLYTASLLARDPTFDLVYMDVIWTPKFAAAGWLLPLDDRLSPAEREAFLPEALAVGEYRGRLYRVPLRTDVGLLYYRRDWLAAAGLSPPRTFDDLLHAAHALQAPPQRWGFVWQGKQYEGLVCTFLEVLRGFGGFWIEPRTLAVGLDRPQASAALAFLVRCARDEPISPPGVATYEEEESRRLFHDGRAVFLRNWPYVWQLAQTADSPLRGRVGVAAMVHAPGGRPAATLGGWGLGISSYSRHPDQAMAFIRFATRLESQRALCGPTGFAPARKEAYRDAVLLRANPFLAELERLHRDAVARPAIARYAQASDILQRQVSAALAGSRTVDDALRAAARQTRLLLGGARRRGGPP